MDAFDAEPTATDTLRAAAAQTFQQVLDRSTVHLVPRWLAFAAAVALYALRVYVVQGWFIVTRGTRRRNPRPVISTASGSSC